MEKVKIALLILPIILFIVSFMFKKSHEEATQKPPQTHQKHIQKLDLYCNQCVEKYVEYVINEGLDIFGYPTSPMPAKTVNKEDAKKIAAFVASLQGLKPSHPEWVKEGKYLFYGNCTGCHSNGGKGKEGYFPDLTKPLKGMQILQKRMQNGGKF